MVITISRQSDRSDGVITTTRARTQCDPHNACSISLHSLHLEADAPTVESDFLGTFSKDVELGMIRAHSLIFGTKTLLLVHNYRMYIIVC